MISLVAQLLMPYLGLMYNSLILSCYKLLMIKDSNLTHNKPYDCRSLKLKHIRSFVRREGRITRAQEQALIKLWPKYGIQATRNEVDLNQTFNRPGGLSIEIGFGDGQSMLHIAKLQPHWNHLGIEVHRPGIGHLMHHADQQGLTNLKVICDDAVDVLKNMVPDKSIQRLLIFFPDPWHKKRHHKRRLIQKEFIELAASKLVYGGIIHMATDWHEYAQHMLSVMDVCTFFTNCADQGPFSEKPTYRQTTKFEARGKRLGHGVYDLIYKKAK